MRALLQTSNVRVSGSSDGGAKVSTSTVRKMYDSLLHQGFRVSDVEDALRAVGELSSGAFAESDVLDWLCLHVPNVRLPRKFQTVERSEYKLDADSSVEATAAQAGTAPAPEPLWA